MQTAVACFMGLLQVSLFSPIQHVQDWVPRQMRIARQGMYDNISREGAARGSVVAGTSRHNPNYFYHWVRDSALVMDVVMSLYEKAVDPAEREKAKNTLKDYVAFSRANQLTNNPSGDHTGRGLGEPKFEADGSAFTAGWGRPQNDGPALRAKTLIRFANHLLDIGEGEYVANHLYKEGLPAYTVIKADLEFVSHHWHEMNFDIWEETYGMHFYTLLVQRSSLIDGGRLADRLGDEAASAWYFRQAEAIEARILEHWNDGKGQIDATLPAHYVPHKSSGLDSAVILGVLHANRNDKFFDVADDRVMATILAQERAFKNLYPINQRGENMEPAIGRYPEDQYDGYRLDRPGNPWVLTTLAFAEYYYRLENTLQTRGEIRVTPRTLVFMRSLGISAQLRPYDVIRTGSSDFAEILRAVRAKGDRFLNRVKDRTPENGKWSEQIGRNEGEMAGATELTWGYIAFLSAVFARNHQNPGVYF